ncbi:hypothetical protein T09_4237 [Trichinella sp. T9]|nr:hypothetical protein T09_4237 [Trichinella sp. T9]
MWLVAPESTYQSPILPLYAFSLVAKMRYCIALVFWLMGNSSLCNSIFGSRCLTLSGLLLKI